MRSSSVDCNLVQKSAPEQVSGGWDGESRPVETTGDPDEVSDHRGSRYETEAIKLAFVIHALRQRSQEFETAVVHTGQHRTMLDHALQFFKFKPDFDLDVMRPNQTLNSLTGRVLDTVENACHRFEPNMVLVQAIPPQLLPRPWRLTTARCRASHRGWAAEP
jgi:hypothetical protein